jgi:glucose-1-phosphate adenylyltransferase
VTTTTGSDDSAGASRFVRAPLALVLAGGCGSRLAGLTAWQTKAAVPFGGRYRAIDFTLSNCVNSGLRRIALLTQYKSQSLIGHVHGGWGFLHRELGEYVEVWPAQQRDGERWYGGTLDAVYQNLDLIAAADPSHVLVLAGDQVYSLDYSLLLEEHAARGADVIVACVDLPPGEGKEYDSVIVGEDLRVESIVANGDSRLGPAGSRGFGLAPMGVYLFSSEFLFERLIARRNDTAAGDFGRDLLPAAARDARVFAYVVRDGDQPAYWRDIGTIDRYWRAHMELLGDIPPRALMDPSWPVFTRYQPVAPARILHGATLDAALVSPGCTVEGRVERSVLSTRCSVGEGAIVKDSVLLPGARVGAGCVLDRVIVDGEVSIPACTTLGWALGAEHGYYVSPLGVLLVTAAGPEPRRYANRNVA